MRRIDAPEVQKHSKSQKDDVKHHFGVSYTHWCFGNIATGFQFCMLGITVNHHPLEVKLHRRIQTVHISPSRSLQKSSVLRIMAETHINRHTVVHSLANYSLPVDIYVFSVFNGQSLDVFAVQIQRDRLGLYAKSNFMPIAVKQVVNFRVFEHSSDSIFCQPHSIVLHRLVLAVQTNGHLSRYRTCRCESVTFKT